MFLLVNRSTVTRISFFANVALFRHLSECKFCVSFQIRVSISMFIGKGDLSLLNLHEIRHWARFTDKCSLDYCFIPKHTQKQQNYLCSINDMKQKVVTFQNDSMKYGFYYEYEHYICVLWMASNDCCRK